MPDFEPCGNSVAEDNVNGYHAPPGYMYESLPSILRTRVAPWCALPFMLALGLTTTQPSVSVADAQTDLLPSHHVYVPIALSGLGRGDIQTRCWTRYQRDDGDDGVDVTMVSFYVDPEQVIESFTLTHSDQNTSRVLFQYDNAGRTVEARRDDESDGVVDRIWQYGYNEDGVMIWRFDDHDADGVSDNSSWFFMDDRNRQIRAEYDQDGDTVLDVITYTEYGEDGRTSLHLVDDGADGSIDQATADRWERGANFERLYIDENNDGTINRIAQSLFDSEGREIEFGMDRNADGVYDDVEKYYFNPRGLRERWESYVDGHLHVTSLDEYDDEDRIVKNRSIGLFSTRTATYEYGCSWASAVSAAPLRSDPRSRQAFRGSSAAESRHWRAKRFRIVDDSEEQPDTESARLVVARAWRLRVAQVLSSPCAGTRRTSTDRNRFVARASFIGAPSAPLNHSVGLAVCELIGIGHAARSASSSAHHRLR